MTKRVFEMKTIQYPEGITMLMQNLWLCHKAGVKQSGCNVFMVELPPLTEEELAETCHLSRNGRPEDDPEELFGAWI